MAPHEVKDDEMALIPRVDVQALMAKAIESNSGIEVLERLVALQKEVRAQRAKEAFNLAMAEFQKDRPQIFRTEHAKFSSTSGRVKYSYAPLEEILAKVQPKLGPLGLSISWQQDTPATGGIVRANCRISHSAGHSEESGWISMPVSNRDTAADPAQRVGIALTYALRYAVRGVLGINAEDDPDAAPEEEEQPEVQQPQRASSKQAPPPATGPNPMTGIVQKIISKSGKKTDGSTWHFYVITLTTGEEFKTFLDADAKFAKEAGSTPVSITWEPDTKHGGRLVKSIDPAEGP